MTRLQAHVFLRTRLDECETRAELPRLAHAGAGLHAETFRFPAGGDAARRIRHHGNHGNRPPAQLRLQQLFHGGEVGIEIDNERAQQSVPRPGLR